MSTWAGVVRISHMGERKAGASNVHADREQVEEIERHAAAHGAQLEVLPPELDVSGGLPLEERPSLRAAVEGVESGEYGTLIVAYLSRLGRRMDMLRVWDRVEAAGGRIIVVREGIDTSTPTGRHFRTMLLSQATMEREQHAERFENLREWATAAGVWQRRQTPRGYSRDEQTRRLVPDDDAGEVRWAFQARGKATPITTLADRLKMTTSGARALLKNRVYLGELKVGTHVNDKAHPPLVTEAEFEAAQTNTPRPARSADGPALLAGLVRCASCGHVMSRKRTANVVYACPGRHSGARCPGPASITTSLVDAHVERIALAELARLSVSASEGRGVDRAQAKLADAESERGAYLSGVKAAGLPVEAFAAGAREREDAVEAARAELRAELGRRSVVPNMGTGADVWESLDGHERNQLLRSLLSAVVVARAGGRGSRTPLEDRVRVLAFGADVQLPQRRGGEAAGIVPIPLPDLDDPRVLRLPAGED